MEQSADEPETVAEGVTVEEQADDFSDIDVQVIRDVEQLQAEAEPDIDKTGAVNFRIEPGEESTGKGFAPKEKFRQNVEAIRMLEKIEGENGDEYIRKMVAFFFEAVKQGDKPATEYCERMATRGAQLISALAGQMNFGGDEIEVVLSGSINVKLDNKLYLDMLLSKAESMSGKKLKFIKLEAMPVTGCINWIMQDYVK